MIRINLLGQARPKAGRKAVDLGAALPAALMGAGVLFGGAVLAFYYTTLQKDLNKAQDDVKRLKAEKTNLERIKQEVESFEAQQKVLQQRVSIIEQLQRDRTGGQELMDAVANTVSRTENLWLTTMTKKGKSLTVNGVAASLNSVANFITQLKRSGYFEKIEIKHSTQDDKATGIETFVFELSADIAPPAPAATAKPANAPQAAPAKKAASPAKKG
ncbi:MAG: PilN domain-containing protein [Acidobacteriia bacterium]|nr:PilN domain-containing protein [Terriglobia bacterium]